MKLNKYLPILNNEKFNFETTTILLTKKEKIFQKLNFRLNWIIQLRLVIKELQRPYFLNNIQSLF